MQDNICHGIRKICNRRIPQQCNRLLAQTCKLQRISLCRQSRASMGKAQSQSRNRFARRKSLHHRQKRIQAHPNRHPKNPIYRRTERLCENIHRRFAQLHSLVDQHEDARTQLARRAFPARPSLIHRSSVENSSHRTQPYRFWQKAHSDFRIIQKRRFPTTCSGTPSLRENARRQHAARTIASDHFHHDNPLRRRRHRELRALPMPDKPNYLLACA